MSSICSTTSRFRQSHLATAQIWSMLRWELDSLLIDILLLIEVNWIRSMRCQHILKSGLGVWLWGMTYFVGVSFSWFPDSVGFPQHMSLPFYRPYGAFLEWLSFDLLPYLKIFLFFSFCQIGLTASRKGLVPKFPSCWYWPLVIPWYDTPIRTVHLLEKPSWWSLVNNLYISYLDVEK